MTKREPQSVRRKRSDKALKDAGAQITVAEGYQAVTFERIGEKSGYSRSLISQKYGSKEKFLLALLQDIAETGRQGYEAELATQHRALQKIENYIGVFFDRIANDKQVNAYFILLADALANRRPLQDFFQGRHVITHGDLASLIEQGQKDGDVDPALDPALAATVIGSLTMGVAMQALLEPGTDLEPVTRSAMAAVNKVLAPS